MPLTKLHPRDIQRIDWTVRTVEGAPIVHPNETRKRRMPISSPFRRARVSDYAFDESIPPIRTHYMGQLIDASGTDIGDEIELFCQRGVLDTEPDIRYYWPRLIVTGAMATGLIVVPVIESVGEPPDEKSVQRWYFTGIFAPWCEREAEPGRIPDLDKPPVEPFPPGLPVPPEDVFELPEGPFRPAGRPAVPGLPIPPDGLVPTEGPFRPPGGPLVPGDDDHEDEPRGCGGGYAG